MFRSIFSSVDKELEAHNVLGAMGVLVFFGLVIYSVVWKGQPFDPLAYGQAFVFILAGVGLAATGAGVQRKLQGDTTTTNQ